MKSETVVVVAIGAAAVLYFVMKNKAMAAQPGFTSLGNAQGIAHSPGITTGGTLSVLGAAIPSLQSWFGGGAQSPSQIQTDQYTPTAGFQTTISNPVSASPTVLPYSYKQQNIDTPSMLNTDSMFTPSYSGGGSSGSYSDQSSGDGSDDILNNGF